MPNELPVSFDNHKSYIIGADFSFKAIFTQEEVAIVRKAHRDPERYGHKHLMHLANSDVSDDDFIVAVLKQSMRDGLRDIIREEVIDNKMFKNLSPVKISITTRI